MHPVRRLRWKTRLRWTRLFGVMPLWHRPGAVSRLDQDHKARRAASGVEEPKLDHDTATPHSVWLCPGGGQGAALAGAIAELADRFAMPVFEPHVTLLGDLRGAPEITAAACRSPATELPGTTARIRRVAQTADFFMSLFLDVDVDVRVASARLALARGLGVDVSRSWRAHLSLAYGLPAGAPGHETLRDLSHRFVGQTLTLNEIRIVRSAQEIAIRDWRTLHIERLK